jgi:hypothetical protein
MKSALANIGEHGASKRAASLEEAGINKDMDFIAEHIDGFIATLQALIEKLEPPETADTETDGESMVEDTDFLREQLESVLNACGMYDIMAANTAFNRLDEKPWKPGTKDTIEKIRDMLILYSDFDEAAVMVEAILSKGTV